MMSWEADCVYTKIPKCPYCKEYVFPEDNPNVSGKLIDCPHCRKIFTVNVQIRYTTEKIKPDCLKA